MNAISKLLEKGHRVRGFDIKTRGNSRRASKYGGRIEVAWGDIRQPADVAAAVKGQEVIIHLAFLLPPVSEERPMVARDINVGGTRNLMDVMKTATPSPRIIFSSSFTVFGETQDQKPPRKASDPVQATDNYTAHKLECEQMLRESGLKWCVYRFGVVPPMALGGFTPKVYDIPVSTRVEFLHPQDAALAMANGVSSDEIWGKVLLIGGGRSCQLHYGDFINRILEGMGVGRLPDEAFGFASAYTDWLDTRESQKLLQYQQHSFDEFVQEVSAKLGPAKHALPLFRPAVRRWLLNMSPYYKARE